MQSEYDFWTEAVAMWEFMERVGEDLPPNIERAATVSKRLAHARAMLAEAEPPVDPGATREELDALDVEDGLLRDLDRPRNRDGETHEEANGHE